jgi:hypothetical protein
LPDGGIIIEEELEEVPFVPISQFPNLDIEGPGVLVPASEFELVPEVPEVPQAPAPVVPVAAPVAPAPAPAPVIYAPRQDRN